MKKYNPFKLAGSYIGLILLPLAFQILFYLESQKAGFIGMAILPSIIVTIILIPIGFFVGWGIHLLIRRFGSKNLYWFLPLIIVIFLAMFISSTKYSRAICGDGICQEGEIIEGRSFCDIDCQDQCISATGSIQDDVEAECSVGWNGTYLNLVDKGVISIDYLMETPEIDFSDSSIQTLANQLRQDTIKETAKSIAEWTYLNIDYTETYTYFDCITTKASEVIERKSGLCSTMSKVNIALLRANGIPAYSVTGCWKFNEACKLVQTFYMKTLAKFLPIKIKDGFAATTGSLHNWVIVPLYQDGDLKNVLLESTTGTLFKNKCLNYRIYYENPSDSRACGLSFTDSSVDDCKTW